MICRAMLAGILLAAGVSHAALDDFYYSYDEIEAELDSLAAAHPTVMRVDSIGYAWASGRPIWSVKLSQDVMQELDKPALWVNGQCHAEEILGVSISMAFIRELAHWGDLGHPNYAPFLQAMEIHVVPSNNPDGLDVVLAETDRTYRKNLHPFLPDASCQIAPGVGNDSCGVDLNRNYPAWFEHGDGLWELNDDVELFDYYRGPEPLSEPECAAVHRQMERERFVAAVAYHSARTSGNIEIIIHPWEWENPSDRRCPAPDYDMMQGLTRSMGNRIQGSVYEVYRNIAGKGRKGSHHNYAYNHYGAVGLLIEVGSNGDAGMQPQDQATIDWIVDQNLNGLYWLCRRIIGFQVDAPGLRLHTRHEGNPLEARLRLQEVMHENCTPWYRTDPQWGAYYRLLKPRSYTLAVRKHGFAAVDQPVIIGNSAPTSVVVDLQALPTHALELAFRDPLGPITVERVELLDHNADTTLVWENLEALSTSLPEGEYTLRAFSGSHISAIATLQLFGDLEANQILHPRSDTPPDIDRSFLSLADFEQLGAGCDWAIEDFEGQAVFNDNSGEWYAADQDCELRSLESFSLQAPLRENTPGTLEFDYFHVLEGGRDSAFVVIHSLSEGTSSIVREWTGRSPRWERALIDLGDWEGQEIRFGFRVKTDELVHDWGLMLRNIRLSWSAAATSVASPSLPAGFALQVAPNPFNPHTTVQLSFPQQAIGARLQLRLYDLLGRQVLELAGSRVITAASVFHSLDGSALASGVYLLDARVSREGRELFRETRWVALVK